MKWNVFRKQEKGSMAKMKSKVLNKEKIEMKRGEEKKKGEMEKDVNVKY